MLILANANGLGVDLNQLGQWILQAAGNGDRTAQGHIEVGEFAGGEFGRRIDGRARLADHQLGRLVASQLFDQISHQGIGLARAGAIANGDQFHIVASDQRAELGHGALHILARREGIDRAGGQQLARCIDNRHLHAGADAGIQPHGGFHAGGGGHQKGLEIGDKDLDGFLLGPFADLGRHLGNQPFGEFVLPGPVDHLLQKAVASWHSIVITDGVFGKEGSVFLDIDAKGQEACFFAAQHGQHPVAGGFGPALAMVEIVSELLPFCFLAFRDFCFQHGGAFGNGAQLGGGVGV